MTVTDAQVRKLMEELDEHGKTGLAALRSGMDRKTARKYVAGAKLPSELRAEVRPYRTREDPFEEDWVWVEEQLSTSPDFEAKTLFEALQEKHPDRYEDGQLRTLQRRVRDWRAQRGPEREVFFQQEHRAGEALQLDFTYAASLGVTISGESFPHLLCHVVLPYSNWQHVSVCKSESLVALKRGLQAALVSLGHVPAFLQTDNSTAATHKLSSGKRGFNDDYMKLVAHFGLTPRTTGVGKKEQNGDVEAGNGALKRRVKQQLLLRGSSDFASEAEYEAWLESVCAKANRGRQKRFCEELKVMSPLKVAVLPEFIERRVTVTSWSTIRIERAAYSVPSRLIGRTLRVRVYENRLGVYYGNTKQFELERVTGRQHRIDYRHVIWSLVQKPGAFARYRYRDELFPTAAFRRAYDVIAAEEPNRKGDLEYLRILHLAAATMEHDVDAALCAMLNEKTSITSDAVRARLPAREEVNVPDLSPYEPSLASYDDLLEEAQ